MLLELEVLGSKERRKRPPDPRGSSQPAVRAPDRQGGPGDGTWELRCGRSRPF